MASSNQNGFRKTLLFYLKTNANPKLLFKLMKASKYFCFKEFPFFVIQNIEYSNRKWWYHPLNSNAKMKYEKLNIDKISKQFWITQNINVFGGIYINMGSELISRMVVCNIKSLFLQNQEISLHELKFLVNDNLKRVELYGVIVKDSNRKPLLIEKVLRLLINVPDITYHFRKDFSSQFNSDSTKNIMEVLKQSKIGSFWLFQIPEMFDIDAFFNFMKENLQIRFRIYFRDVLNDAYKEKLQNFTDEIDAPFMFKGPIMIRFYGQILKPAKFNGRIKKF